MRPGRWRRRSWESVLEAARAAPSAGNLQAYEVWVVSHGGGEDGPGTRRPEPDVRGRCRCRAGLHGVSGAFGRALRRAGASSFTPCRTPPWPARTRSWRPRNWVWPPAGWGRFMTTGCARRLAIPKIAGPWRSCRWATRPRRQDRPGDVRCVNWSGGEGGEKTSSIAKPRNARAIAEPMPAGAVLAFRPALQTFHAVDQKGTPGPDQGPGPAGRGSWGRQGVTCKRFEVFEAIWHRRRLALADICDSHVVYPAGWVGSGVACRSKGAEKGDSWVSEAVFLPVLDVFFPWNLNMELVPVDKKP